MWTMPFQKPLTSQWIFLLKHWWMCIPKLLAWASRAVLFFAPTPSPVPFWQRKTQTKKRIIAAPCAVKLIEGCCCIIRSCHCEERFLRRGNPALSQDGLLRPQRTRTRNDDKGCTFFRANPVTGSILAAQNPDE